MAETLIKNTDTPPAGGGDEKLFNELIPAEFKDKTYLKDLGAMKQGPEAMTELFKKLDGAQTLVGKKTGAPATDAPPEEWDTFFGGFRPEKSEDYEIKSKEGSKPDEDFTKMLQGAFHSASMTKRQAAKFQEPVMKFLADRETAAVEAGKKQEVEFDTLVKATFGADHAKVLERTNALLKDHVPDNLKDHIGKLSNEGLTILSGVIESIRKKYISEDDLGEKDPSKTDAGGEAELRAEGIRLMGSDEFQNAFNPKHAEIKAKVDEIYARIGKMVTAKK